MTDTQLSLMLSRQMPDAQKRAKATYLIETKSLEQTRAAVRALIEELREKNA
jgi:dephospho-CoA kinase